ncbi:MAG: HypC/HybG/HupF family hydrogenase formation chaperone [Chloroflexi bacterium HGW-Chloroflexi-10]|nr:MAG: HypC/HybG/HupF family hydrogenase formation chaperone [Chloroflexi bacterium HGW-Chloroflexi-10]
MCLGVPGKIIEIDDSSGMRMAKIDFGGVIRQACIEAIPEAIVGDYTIIHAGFALNVLSEADAMETLSLLTEISNLNEELGIDGQAA